MKKEKIKALILAAGKGTRIKAQKIPKVLYPLLEKPMILYSIEALKKAGFRKPVIVVGFQGKKVKELLKDKAVYVWQKRQLGTGHAVLQAKKALSGTDSVLIIYGDMPLWQPETFKKLIKTHQKTKAIFSMVTVIFKNPEFFQYGRIIRDEKGKLVGIVEEKEASADQKKIKESNPGCYLIKTHWLFKNLPKIKKSASGEYYLTDLLALAVKQDVKINIVPISDWRQAVGINTKKQLALAEKILQSQKSAS